ncbi:hypothetical protein SBA5_560049 [Candidatus Sulfotelmatomonas gaucii]|uniref:Uncharacterized protein n=1 Tax=Candidatus Sulfuritelmatomonas gaucii TaxID=2043161 RepID=A0A2N9LUS0_9BACT|nr:hypothetical protein SBA5_560049 [Candidatus Sulfotelmatomonas gaucii]
MLPATSRSMPQLKQTKRVYSWCSFSFLNGPRRFSSKRSEAAFRPPFQGKAPTAQTKDFSYLIAAGSLGAADAPAPLTSALFFDAQGISRTTRAHLSKSLFPAKSPRSSTIPNELPR